MRHLALLLPLATCGLLPGTTWADMIPSGGPAGLRPEEGIREAIAGLVLSLAFIVVAFWVLWRRKQSAQKPPTTENTAP